MQQLISKVEFDPTSSEYRIEHAFEIDPDNLGDVAGNESELAEFEPMAIGHSNKMASPGGGGPIPVLRGTSNARSGPCSGQ